MKGISLRGPYKILDEGVSFVERSTPATQHQNPIFKCCYCQSTFSNCHGSCPNCGSSNSNVLFLPGGVSAGYYPPNEYPAY